MKKSFCQLILLLAVMNLHAQNIGINTGTPGSTLSVNGSISAGYNNVTISYLLSGSDYFVVYNGISDATFSLPAALSAGSGNFKGRVYKIKNNSNFLLTVDPAGSEKINLDNIAVISKGTTLEIINTGLTAGSTWEAISGLPGDGIRKVLESGGCVSCTAYDNANLNTWVQITSAEYSLLISGINGLTAYGAPNATMAMTAAGSFAVYQTLTQNFSTMTQMPAGYYPVALSLKTGLTAPAYMSGLNFKLSNTGQSSGYAVFASSFTASAPYTPSSVYYFVLRRPSGQSPAGAASNMAITQTATFQVGVIGSAGNMFYGSGDISNPSNSSAATPLFQVLATAVKAW